VNLAIGTVQFGIRYGISNKEGQVNLNKQKEILSYAQKMGIDMLDTAIEYGESEANLGKCGVNNFKLVTKIPPIPNNLINVTEWIEKHVSDAIKRLGLVSLYGLLLHRSDDLLKYDGEVIRCLKNLKISGVVKKIGVSIYSPHELEKIIDSNSIDIVQSPFSIVDRRVQTTGWLHKLSSLNIEVHARSIFLQGLLLIPKNKLPKKFLKWKELWNKWYTWQADNPRFTPLHACLGFVNDIQNIHRIIIGVENLKQIEEIVNIKKILEPIDFPNISSDDQELLNPSNWSKL